MNDNTYNHKHRTRKERRVTFCYKGKLRFTLILSYKGKPNIPTNLNICYTLYI